MRCGNCHQDHETVAQVRSCYGVQLGMSKAESQEAHSESATQKQLEFIARLEQERGLSPHQGILTKHEASDLISGLLAMPKSVAPVQVQKTADSYRDIPAGHYAVPSLTGNNDLDFFRVDKPTEGQWAGYIFVKRVIGGRPDNRVTKTTKFQALNAIRQASPAAAAMLYARELGRCSICNRHLTDEISRRVGKGPECRARAKVA